MYSCEINGVKLVIRSSDGLFSPRHPDRGTLAMLSLARLVPGTRCLDLGCGCGLVGIYLALSLGQENVALCDVDPLAVKAARENLSANGLDCPVYLSDALDGVPESGFGLILCNPPYQSDFAVAKKLIEKSFNRLEIGGTLMLVTKRRDWYFNKLKAIFGGTSVVEKDGYFVFSAQKRRSVYANRL
ncbi:MAG: methyltransferase [Clostridiales bacterium]|nr:methyltransferase [Clostridiales bacterium]